MKVIRSNADSAIPHNASYHPLYDLNTIKFRTSEKEMLFKQRCQTKFINWWAEQNIDINSYKTNPFNMWDYIWKYRVSDKALRNTFNWPFRGLTNYDMDLIFISNDDASMFYDILKQEFVDNHIEDKFNSSIKLLNNVVSKSCVGRMGLQQLMSWIVAVRKYAKHNNNPIALETLTTPDSPYHEDRKKCDWIYIDTNSDIYLYTNYEYINS